MAKKETKELRNLTRENLLKEKKKAEELKFYCHKGTHPKVPVTNKQSLNIRLARINTLLNENG